MVINIVKKQDIETFVKTFLDIIVMARLSGEPLHGYGIIADLHKTFGVLLSPGILYPLLYELEKEKLVEVETNKRKKMYNLSPQGQKMIIQAQKLYEKNSRRIFNFIDENLEETLHTHGGYCKEIRGRCVPLNCPLIIK